MIEKILFTIIAFVLFVYVFLFKMIKKNDTTYLAVVIIQALGILLDFVQIISGQFSNIFLYILMYLLCVFIPVIICILDSKGVNCFEIVSSFIAKIYIYKKNYKKAKNILISLLNKKSDSYIGHKLLAEIYEKEGGMRKAIDEYVRVLDIKKNDYNSYYKISILLKDLNKKDESIEMLMQLVKQKPDFADASSILGELLYEKGEFKSAINVYTNALQIKSENIDMIYNLGIAYVMMNNFSFAKKSFEKVVELDNNNYYAYYRLGQIALLYRDFDNAEYNFLKGANNEYEARAYFELTKIYVIKSQKEKAVIYANKAIEVDSNYYDKTKTEPMLFFLKDQIVKSKNNNKNVNFEISNKEKQIEEYLFNTYNLTKSLNMDDAKEKPKFRKLKFEN